MESIQYKRKNRIQSSLDSSQLPLGDRNFQEKETYVITHKYKYRHKYKYMHKYKHKYKHKAAVQAPVHAQVHVQSQAQGQAKAPVQAQVQAQPSILYKIKIKTKSLTFNYLIMDGRVGRWVRMMGVALPHTNISPLSLSVSISIKSSNRIIH